MVLPLYRVIIAPYNGNTYIMAKGYKGVICASVHFSFQSLIISMLCAFMICAPSRNCNKR